jgi:hypothetical protein
MNKLTILPNEVSLIGSPKFFCCMEIYSLFCKTVYNIYFYKKIENHSKRNNIDLKKS